MKIKENALLRQIASPAYKISLIIAIALSVLLTVASSALAQLPSNYGKPNIVHGKLFFAPTGQNAMGSTLTSSSMVRIVRYEPLSDKLAKLDYITKRPDKHLSLRINGSKYAMCLVHLNPQGNENKNNGSIRFSGTLKVSSNGQAPGQLVLQQGEKDENKKKEENKTPALIFPTLVLLQDESGTIRFLAQTDETTLLEYELKNFWELFILLPESCQNDFFELMSYFNPSVFNNKQAILTRIYSGISQNIPFTSSTHSEYQKLIDDLASDVYMKRVAATNRIQNEVILFLAYAQNLDLKQLDPEARVRLSSILSNEFYLSETDDIEDLAVLFSDALYLFIPLLESGNEPFHSIAQERLKAKLGDSFQYDKSAPADVRAAQIQELKTRLNFPKARAIQMDEQMQKRFKNLTDSILDQNVGEFKL